MPEGYRTRSTRFSRARFEQGSPGLSCANHVTDDAHAPQKIGLFITAAYEGLDVQRQVIVRNM
jgi:hypothetical protein